MTSEIAILNKEGIAIAADSAVTIGDSKIYNSVNKLFELSKLQPIGVMIYGSSEFMGIPWEVIIKIIRNKIHSEKINFSKLEDSKDYFFTELKKIMSKNSKLETFENKIIEIFQILINDANSYIDKKQPTENEFKRNKVLFLEESFQITNEIILNHNNLKEVIKLDNLKEIINKIILNLDESVVSWNYFSLEDFKKINIDKIFKIIENYLYNDIFITNYSGIVISGFGEEDIFPKLFEFNFEITYDSYLKYIEKTFIEISETKTTAVIQPFAQDGEVRTFLEGIHPYFKNEIIVSFQTYINTFLEEIITEPRKIKSFEEIKINLFREFEENINNYSNEFHIQEIIESVIHLPKTELCEMAESLINLMSFKQKMTFTTESVGGPIDTAFISKGDGFIWIKRKHYFKPELNHNFFK